MIRRRAAWLTLILVIVVAALTASVTTRVGTQASLLLLQHLSPALQLEGSDGSWVGGLHIQQLRWQDNVSSVTAENVHLKLEPLALLKGRFSLSRAGMQNLSLIPAPAPVNSRKNSQHLPNLSFPFGLDIKDLQVGTLIVKTDTSHRFDHFNLSGSWHRGRLKLSNLSAQSERWSLVAHGTLTTTKDYELGMNVSVVSEQSDDRADVKLSGSMRTLKVRASIDGNWPAKLSAQVQPLHPQLPFTARLQTSAAINLSKGKAPLTLQALTVSAKGNREALKGSATLDLQDPFYGHTRLLLKPRWRDEELVISDIRWQFSDLTEANKVKQPLQGECLAQRAGEWSCDGRLEHLPLPPSFQTRGHISTRIKAGGNWRSPTLFNANFVDIDGGIGKAALHGRLSLEGRDKQIWHINQLELHAGDNHLQAVGFLGARNQLQASLQLTALSQLNPLWHGRLQGKLRLDGEFPELNIATTVTSHDLRLPGFTLAQANMDMQVARGLFQPSYFRVEWNALKLEQDSALDNAISGSLYASGDRQTIDWDAVLSDTLQHRLQAQCQQTATDNPLDLWLTCSRLDLHRANGKQSLALAKKPFSLRWEQSASKLEITATCWNSLNTNGTVCLESPFSWQQGSTSPLNTTVSQLPLEWLLDLFPRQPELTSASPLSGSLSIQEWQPLRADARFQIPSISWRLPGEKLPQPSFQMDAISGALKIHDNLASLEINADSSSLGSMGLQLKVSDPTTKHAGLQGLLSVKQLQVGAFSWLLPEDFHFDGQLDSNITLGGSLDKPQFNGLARLYNASLETAAAPVELDNLNADIYFDRRHIRFEAGFEQRQSEGRGRASGTLHIPDDWRQWQLKTALTAEHIQVQPMPDSHLVASALLNLSSTATALDLNGSIDLDQADIRMKQMPPDVPRVSADAEIIGIETETDERQFSSDLTFRCKDDCHFRGFGADVNLKGDLRIRQKAAGTRLASGTVKIVGGRYRAYGQRLSIKRGEFIFNGPMDNPDINIQAVRDMPLSSNIVVGVNITGPLQNPEATLFSEPDMPETDKMFYLLTGKPPPTFENRQPVSSESVLLAIGLAGTNEKAARVAERFGITDLQISGTTTEEGSEAEISGYISPRIYLRYGSGFREGTSTVTLQYHLTRKLLLEATSGFRQSLDLLYSFNLD